VSDPFAPPGGAHQPGPWQPGYQGQSQPPPPDFGPPGAGYGYPPGGYPPFYAPPRQTNSLALTSMIVSIASLVICAPIGVVGAILGHRARRQCRELGQDGDGLALAGVIVGWIGFGLTILIVVVYAVIFAVLAANGGLDSGTYS
jgi:hypothetical protein